MSSIKTLKTVLLGLATVLCLALFSSVSQAHDPHDVVQQVALSPSYAHDRSIYLLVRGNFLKSVDGGLTWQRQVQGLDHQTPLTAFAIASPNHLYLSTAGDGLYESSNGGETWHRSQPAPPDMALGQIGVSPNNADFILAAGQDKHLYRRNDQGWNLALSTESPVSAISFTQNYMLIGDHQGQLYASSDQGQTWSHINTVASGVTTITLSKQTTTPAFFIGTEHNGVLYATDGGKTLTPINQGLPNKIIYDVESTTTHDGQEILFASADQDGVYLSENGGESWTLANAGLTTTAQADKMGHPHFTDLAVSPSFDQDGTLLVSGFDGLFKTTDRGRQWTQLETLPGDIVMALAVSPNYAHDKTLVATTYVGEAYISQDGGDHWTAMAKGLELPYFTNTLEPIERNDDPRRFQSLVFSPKYRDDQTVFATILNNGVLRHSSDQGWQLQRFDQWERALAIAAASDRTLFIGTQSGRFYRSHNSGKTFTQISKLEPQQGNESPFMVISPNYAEDKTIFITGADGVYKTTDGGLSWQTMTAKLTLANRLKLAISPSYEEDSTLWLGTSDGLLQSTDGGTSWTDVISNAYGHHPYIEAVAVSPNYRQDRTLMVSVRGRGLFKSRDGGYSFTAIEDAALPIAVVNNFEYGAMPLVFSPDYAHDTTIFGFGATQGEIFKSSDGGQTWQTLPLPDATVFSEYNRYQYSLISQIRFFFHIHQSRLAKLILACLAGSICYVALSGAARFWNVLRLQKPIRLGAATAVVGVAIAILFV